MVMTFPDRIVRFDDWLLDNLFQPIANRLPARMTALRLGLACQIGALTFDALSLLLPMVLFGFDIGDMITGILIWGINLAFYLGMKRSAPMVQPGFANPLRPMLRAMRLMALAFLVYEVFRGIGVPAVVSLIMQVTTLSQLFFTVGLYLAACQPRAPRTQVSTRRGPIIDGVWSNPNRLGS